MSDYLTYLLTMIAAGLALFAGFNTTRQGKLNWAEHRVWSVVGVIAVLSITSMFVYVTGDWPLALFIYTCFLVLEFILFLRDKAEKSQ